MGELRQAVRLAADDAGGYRTLAGRSMGRISPSTLNNIATGKHSGVMKSEQLAGLAMVIGRPAPEVARMLGQPYADPGRPFTLPERANALTQQQRRVVLSVVDAILSAQQAATAPERPLRAVASGQRGAPGAAQREAKEKAAKARREQERP
jgi:hypothetical protein